MLSLLIGVSIATKHSYTCHADTHHSCCKPWKHRSKHERCKGKIDRHRNGKQRCSKKVIVKHIEEKENALSLILTQVDDQISLQNAQWHICDDVLTVVFSQDYTATIRLVDDGSAEQGVCVEICIEEQSVRNQTVQLAEFNYRCRTIIPDITHAQVAYNCDTNTLMIIVPHDAVKPLGISDHSDRNVIIHGNDSIDTKKKRCDKSYKARVRVVEQDNCVQIIASPIATDRADWQCKRLPLAQGIEITSALQDITFCIRRVDSGDDNAKTTLEITCRIKNEHPDSVVKNSLHCAQVVHRDYSMMNRDVNFEQVKVSCSSSTKEVCITLPFDCEGM
ncbi:MAG: hypothetical protein WBQ73_02785 [Candidatus Babeliales bacterium]